MRRVRAPCADAGEARLLDVWIAQAYRADARGVVLCPSSAGVAALHQLGRNAWITRLSKRLEWSAPAERWRLLDTAPQSLSDAQIDAVLDTPRPQQPAVLEDSGDATHRRLQLRIPLDLEQLDGHFASAPVLPGFMQVGWVLALAASRMGTPAACTEIEALKFRQFLRPGDEPQLELQLHRNPGKLHFAFRNAESACSSGRLRLEIDHD